MFRSPDNDVDEGKQHGHPSPLTCCQHAKGEECAAQPGMLSDVVEDEQGGEHEGVGEYEESHGATEEDDVLRHPEEISTFQKKILRYSIKGQGTWLERLMRSLGMSSLYGCLVNTD